MQRKIYTPIAPAFVMFARKLPKYVNGNQAALSAGSDVRLRIMSEAFSAINKVQLIDIIDIFHAKPGTCPAEAGFSFILVFHNCVRPARWGWLVLLRGAKPPWRNW